MQQLLDIVRQQQESIKELDDEIVRLKGLKTRPMIAPSPLEAPPPPPREPGQKRPGSAKRGKTARLIITDEVVPCPTRQPDRSSKVTKTLSFRILSSTPGSFVIAVNAGRPRRPEPGGLAARRRPARQPLGPDLIAFIIHQYHHQHVTQPLLEQLNQRGINISAGQISRILTEDKDVFHQEKAELLPAGLEVSSYVQVDDTGARHQGHNGFCTHIGNELFAYFESTDSKSRRNFLEVLRAAHRLRDRRRRGGLLGAAEVVSGGDRAVDDRCVVVGRRCGLAGLPHRAAGDRSAARTDRHRGGVAGELDGTRRVTGADGPQRWSRAIRHLRACVVLAPCGAALWSDWCLTTRSIAGAIERIRRRIWELYAGLKAYRESPEPLACEALGKQFDDLVAQRTDYPSIDGVLKGMASDRAKLLGCWSGRRCRCTITSARGTSATT